jgi:hypothetical protein
MIPHASVPAPSFGSLISHLSPYFDEAPPPPQNLVHSVQLRVLLPFAQTSNSGSRARIPRLLSLATYTMAITNVIPYIKAEILVDNVALQEYPDDEEQTSTGVITKYIEVRSGAEFVIRYRLGKKPEHDMRVDFLLD